MNTYICNVTRISCFIEHERYKRKAIELNGESFDWLNSPVDVRALYDCSCGRPHGKWATFNGIINDREALRDIKRNRASKTAAKRQRQEEEREKQKLIEDARRAKEYSQNMLECGRSVHHYNTISHKFMEVHILSYSKATSECVSIFNKIHIFNIMCCAF